MNIKTFLRYRRDRNRSSRKVQLGPGKQRGEKLGLVWRNRKKISQIINDYLCLPFFLLIILCPLLSPIQTLKRIFRKKKENFSVVALYLMAVEGAKGRSANTPWD
jgi:hypothetical protein